MDCEACEYWVYERDTGRGWCSRDNDPDDCEDFIMPEDAKAEAKYGREDRY